MNLTCGSWLEQEIHSLSPWWLNKLYKKESYNDKVNRNKWNKKVCLASSQVYFWAPICSTALKMANMRLLTLTVFFNKSPRFLDGASLSKKCWHGTKNKNYINYFGHNKQVYMTWCLWQTVSLCFSSCLDQSYACLKSLKIYFSRDLYNLKICFPNYIRKSQYSVFLSFIFERENVN